ncbi:MAG: carbon-nitrogen family hydrolase [Dethiobacteria bacterium]|nr:carbon-nitrogen family hydrolase [Dethiobacteria bacterium]
MEVSDSETKADRFKRVEGFLDNIHREENAPTMIMLPEIWGTGFFNFNRYAAESEPLQGETYARLAPWAEKIGCYILGGSIVEQDGGDYYNTTMLIAPNGVLTGSYRKIHLFGYQSAESEVMTAGSDLYVLKTSYGTWGFSTCYDLRFPELYRKLVDCGVDTLFVVAAWPLARLEHWLLLNRIRALENLSYLVSCNCAGALKEQVFGGNSMLVDPWGEVVARAGEGEELLAFEIDPDRISAIRADFPALGDRRIDRIN